MSDNQFVSVKYTGVNSVEIKRSSYGILDYIDGPTYFIKIGIDLNTFDGIENCHEAPVYRMVGEEDDTRVAQAILDDDEIRYRISEYAELKSDVKEEQFAEWSVNKDPGEVLDAILDEDSDF
jgi:hypothetical protein